MAKDLTKKQQVFVAEYLTDLDGKRAAISAGYSEKTAESQASQLLKNPKVSQAIEKKLRPKLEKLGISANKVLDGLAQLATYDVRKFFNPDGSIKQVPQLGDDEAAAFCGFEVLDISSKDGPQTMLHKFKLADRGINWERLGRYHKLFTDKVEHSGKVTLEGLVCGGGSVSD